MLCEVKTIETPSSSRRLRTKARTSAAMSGSSEAVGSSSSATFGRARNALASITRVVWPAESPSICRPRRSQTPNRVEQLPDAVAALAGVQAVQPREDVEVLGDRQPSGQPRVGAGEAHLCRGSPTGGRPATYRSTGSRPTSASACSAASGSSSSCRRRWARASRAPRPGPARRRADRRRSSAAGRDRPSSARPPPARARRLGRSHRGRSCGSSTAPERQGGCGGVPDDPADPVQSRHTRSPSGLRRGRPTPPRRSRACDQGLM